MGMIYVDFNYRVGPYGFLASSEVQSKGSLNNGLKDQRKALDWVQKYISKASVPPSSGGNDISNAPIVRR